ncbi:MAG: signal peptidase I [Ruminococcaceae bacterium]|nr:signal peptidase I [Oscillospiraceae bacterium]
MKKKKLIGRIVLILVISLLFGFCAYKISATGFAGNQLPMPFGFGMSVVQSGSMEPELSVGDLIIVQKTKNYELGDMIVFQSGRSLVVHRIVAMDDQKVVTRGDANNAADEEYVKYDSIKGEVTGVVPKIGYVVDVLKSTPVMVTLLALSVVLYVLSLKKERRERVAENKDRDDLQRQIDELKNQLGK